ncbi:hypothetical protein [Pyrococcus abyssi]|uniref:Uncharacterized protein n=1 Tax=Pyrococcus abyssi (strain GE5 / Orsay) TaxID=272844 RepID=G8ZH11_PYRAB|nr:hypothetical protein [Pyrococcus abyssi]CCE70206.1 TPA: hypothetical protein PAB0550.1n [Pyrococcus abyssi GE5]
MGYSIYYKTSIREWDKFIIFIDRVSQGLGLNVDLLEDEVIIYPGLERVEPLRIPRKGYGSVKTFGIEPITSIYLLFLYSLSSFGSVEVWED